MDNSRQRVLCQSNEIIQAKRKTSLKKTQRKEPLRRIWSRGLPSLATNTVKMVVATLHIGSKMNGHISDEEQDNEEEDDNDDDEIFHIGQHVQAHIPDIVLNKLNDLIDQKGNILIPNEHMYNNATLLFLDVSGFTSLTEQYSNDAHLGIDQLTHTLNSYFDKLVSEILINNGDIYKFAGDAILALWTNELNGPEQALKCALYLQEKCGAYETDVDVVLRLKIALAYGSVHALFIGTDEFKHYILTGDCVKDVNQCEQLCEPGDIIITKAVYEQVQNLLLNCEYAPINDEVDRKDQYIAVKYLDSEDNDLNVTKNNDRMNTSNPDISMNEPDNNSNSQLSSLINDSINEELNNKTDNLMKSFLLGCVYQRIERKQSLDYLSELRRVTITFINLDVSDEHYTNNNLYHNVQKVFIQIYELTKMMGGVLTKALLFDKGWSFLCVFGLPGYKQGDDTANALKCAYMIHTTIHKQCQFIDKCSIGVTTGLTYCGVVGHFARCEYTVIGRKVNMAARLMCNYPNIISCDQETYYNSRLNSRFFQILPDKILKGMHNVGIIWQYGDHQNNIQIENNQDQKKIIDIQNNNYPLLGRKVELMIVTAQIMLLDEPLHRRRDLAAIIFEGSRLLQFIAESLENAYHESNCTGVSSYDNTYIPYDSTIPNNIPNENTKTRLSSLNIYGNDCSTIKKSTIRIIKYSCQLEQRFNEFSLLRSLLRQLLQFHHDDKTQYEREQYLLRLFDINKSNDVYLRRNLFLLNDLLDVRFRRSHIETENTNEKNFVRTYETNINELLLHILHQLIDPPGTMGDMYGNTLSSAYSQPRRSSTSITALPMASITTASKILFIIDDIHFADESSLKHLLTLGSHNKCLLILSMKPPRNNNNDRPVSNIIQSISTDSRVYLRRLPGLELRYLATLGCQILSVHKLPAKLVKVLNESCNGIPGFCEQILFDLLRKDKIFIVNTTDTYDQDSNLIEGDADKLLVNSPIKTKQRFNEFSLLRSLLRQLLQFHHDDKTQYEREQYLLRLFDINKSNDVYLRRNLFLLNDLLDVRFRRSHIETENTNEKNFVRTYEININELLLHILHQLIDPPGTMGDMYGNTLSSAYSQPRRSSTSITALPMASITTASKILFIIDDIHFADESSLKHLLTLGSHNKCLLILSMKPPRNNNNDRPVSNIIQSISTDSRVYLRRLPGLELRYLATLGCQILSVHKLPAKLVKVLNESCNGIPGFCEQILFDLLRKDKIFIVNTTDTYDQDSNLIEGDADKLLVNSPIKTSLLKSLFSRHKQILNDNQRQIEPVFSRICLLRDPSSNDFVSHCQQNFQNYIMCRIDRLSDSESLLCKIAAVIGNTFSRTFLWQLVDSQSKKLININSCILDMMQRTIIECAYQQQQQQNQRKRSIKCFCLHNPAGFPSQCRLIAFTHVSIREGIYNSLTDSLKRTLTRNAIDYLEKQCTIVCSTCAPRNDIPFVVQKQDGLTRIIKTSQQRGFVDIVKIAALREIDNTIKQAMRLRSMSSPIKPRSNTSTNLSPEQNTTLTGNLDRNENKSSNKIREKRRNSFDIGKLDSRRTRRSQSPIPPTRTNENDIEIKMDQSTNCNSSDQNLTLISVYPYENNDSEVISSPLLTPPKSKHFFALLKLPKQRYRNSSLSNNRLFKNFDGLVPTPNKLNKKETITKPKRKRKNDKSSRFRSFFRYIFCQLVPLHSNASAIIDANRQSTKDSNDNIILSDTKIISKPNGILQESKLLRKQSSHWQTVRQVLIPSPNKVLRACPNDHELLEQPMFSSELMQSVSNDLNCLNKQTYLTQTFQNLYEQSLLFHTFQSYVQYKNLIQFVYETKQEEERELPNSNKFLNEFIIYNDLRVCQCADYVLTVYIKLVEYHTNLYDMHEKLVDDKRDYLRRKQFDRIIYYR
ncbi:unnamed protein product, partial [Adineta steineri]